MNILKLNTIGLSKPLSVKELSIRPYISGLSYIDDSRVIKQATEELPVYRLCKDYDNGVKFALNLIITDEKVGKAEDYMDKIAKTITANDVKGIKTPFVWTDNVYEVKK